MSGTNEIFALLFLYFLHVCKDLDYARFNLYTEYLKCPADLVGHAYHGDHANHGDHGDYGDHVDHAHHSHQSIRPLNPQLVNIFLLELSCSNGW